ncbi:MAG TPA: conjugative transposon protein TraN [Chryseolinea sp.]|nr:conjugative transposon protein TraN [Chryseolinea sp.]
MFYFLNNLFVRIILAGFLSMVAGRAISQSASDSHVEITFNKTSSIVFPAGITTVDRGSRDVLAQKAKGVNNVLQLKAGRTNFRETNLTVITSDGNLHHFVIRYAEKPERFTIHASPAGADENSETFPLLFQSDLTEAELQKYSERVIATAAKGRVKSTAAFDMRLSLKGIYIRNNTMFYHIIIDNKSNIPYHPDLLRFSVRDKKQPKRTASQELDQVPVYQYGSTVVIDGKSSAEVVYAIPKFTIPDAKRLHIELTEQRGGRHLTLEIKNKPIVNAQLIPAE